MLRVAKHLVMHERDPSLRLRMTRGNEQDDRDDAQGDTKGLLKIIKEGVFPGGRSISLDRGNSF